MTSVIVEADRCAGAPAPFDVLFGQDDGASRIRMVRMVPGADLRVGLHRHEGDVMDDDTEVGAIGEIGMGEWITVIDADGRRREVEAHVPFVPWHRRPPEGAAPTNLDDMIAMLQSTAHLL